VTAARLGTLLLVIVGLAAIGAPWLSTSDVSTHHPDLALASPSLARRALVDRLPPTYRTLDERLPLEWFAGTLVRSADPAEPLLPLGSDSLGRDQWTRLLHGARLSLGLTLAGLTGALGIGTLLGLLAGSHGGWLDSTVMRLADLLLAWPALYVVLVLRAALPLSLPFASLFALMAVVLTLSGWPIVARAVRSHPRVGAGRPRRRRHQRLDHPASSPACSAARHRHPGAAARPIVHPRRGDLVVHRSGVLGADAVLGHDAGRGGTALHAATRAMAARPGCGHRRRDAGGESGRRPPLVR
jgi:hypothetical protein